MTFSSYDLAGPDPNPMSHAEVDELKRLVSINSIKTVYPTIINIGAERGTSTLAMLEERADAYIFSIDIDPCEAEIANIRKASLDDERVVRLLGRSQTIGRFWPFWVEFVWVDGNHSHEGVRGDIDAWWPKIRPGGIIAFHDYFEGEPPTHNPSGAGEAVREWMDNEESFGDAILSASVERIRAFRK